MTATRHNIEEIAAALAAGYCVGPRKICLACHTKIEGLDGVSRGLCDACWELIQKAIP